MAEECTYERIPREQAAEVLEKVIRFRENHDQYERPDDVNALVRLFPGVKLREGHLLDYEIVMEGGSITRILPFARKIDGAEEEDPLLLDVPPPELEGSSDQDAERLYQFLTYERSPGGLFEYAFFVLELWSIRARWHEAEWLASTPVFTQKLFEELIDQARKVEQLDPPDWYGPEAALQEQGGKVRFLVHTSMGWERIYHLEISIAADGRVDQEAGHIFADLGQGDIF
ncbi:MAG: hypothetical protein QGH25_00720 [Candidatus Latescibacteria bacterium]|jgi:hypothetical protein|nr:hypothetical protein [Candidatus Latescibacterota bacterium]